MFELLQKKLSGKIISKIYDKFSGGILTAAEKIELQPGEARPAILLVANPEKEIFYSIVTLDENNTIKRYIKSDKLKTLIESSNFDVTNFDLTELMQTPE